MDRIGLDYVCDYNRIIRMLRLNAKLFTVVIIMTSYMLLKMIS